MFSQKQIDEFNYYAQNLIDIFAWYHGNFSMVLYGLIAIFTCIGIWRFVETKSNPVINLVLVPFVMPFLTYIGVGLVALIFIAVILSNMGNSKAARLQLRNDMHGY